MPTFVNRLLQRPWGFPLVVMLALAGIALTEHVHRRSTTGLQESRLADEVTRHANEANYFALDRVNSLRAYLLQASPAWVERYGQANARLSKSVGAVASFLAQTGPAGPEAAERLQALFATRTADLAGAFEHALAQRNDAALAALRESDAAGRGVALRAALIEAIERAESSRRGADLRVESTTEAVRWLMHALIGAMLLAAFALVRQAKATDVARRQQADVLTREVAERTAELRELAGYLITTREDERARLARELHDEMGGLLSATKLDLARLKRQRELPLAVHEQIEAIGRRVTQVVEIKRQVIENLRPSALDHLGLSQALTLLCQDNAAVMEVPTHQDLEPLELAPDLELTIYRVVQEALTNVRKYSHAREVWVAVKCEGDQVRVSVEDDGVGFQHANAGPGHHGLAGMRLRVESHAGWLELGPRAAGPGASVRALLPVRRRELLKAA